MRNLVLVKPVVEARDITFNSDMTLDRRRAVPSIDMADSHAVSLARALRKEGGSAYDILTLSPGYPSALISQFRSHDCHAVYHICDPLFAGSDSLATSKILARAILYLEARGEAYDLIICGNRSTDAETGQVPSEVAALLSRPIVSHVVSFSKDTLVRVLEDRLVTLKRKSSCVVSCCPKGFVLDPPSLRGMANAAKVPYRRLTNEELKMDEMEVGMKGSPTRVIGTSLGVQTWRKPQWTDDPKLGAKWIRQAIRETEGKESRQTMGETRRAVPRGGGFFVIAPLFDALGWECAMGLISSLARQGKAALCVAMGESLGRDAVQCLNASGGKAAVFLRHARSADDSLYGKSLARYFRGKEGIVLCPATIRMRSILPYAAALLGAGLTADCVAYAFEENRFVQIRPAFEGTSQARIVTKGPLILSTIRPHVYEKARFPLLPSLPVETIECPREGSSFELCGETHTGFASDGQEKVVMSIGAGVADRSLRDRIGKLGFRLGASRKAVNLYGLPYACQIGQTGMILHSDVYVAFGISGAAQHITGISAVKHIIAVNPDRKAPIFHFSDKAVCCRAEEIIGYLERKE